MKPFYQVHIQKTGGTSIRVALGIQRPAHETAQQIVQDVGAEAWGEALTFTFVRNPFERLVSVYAHRKRRDALHGAGSFDEFARGVVAGDAPWHMDDPTMGGPMWRYLEPAGLHMVDYVARFEHLHAEYRLICHSIGFKTPPPLPHHQATDHGPYQEYYTADLRRLVEDYYARDLDLFDYSFWQ